MHQTQTSSWESSYTNCALTISEGSQSPEQEQNAEFHFAWTASAEITNLLFRQFIYNLHGSDYAFSDHVLFVKSFMFCFAFCVCVCVGSVYVCFTFVYSHVQQKVVMRRWVKGQTRGPVEVKTDTRGRPAQK